MKEAAKVKAEKAEQEEARKAAEEISKREELMKSEERIRKERKAADDKTKQEEAYLKKLNVNFRLVISLPTA